MSDPAARAATEEALRGFLNGGEGQEDIVGEYAAEEAMMERLAEVKERAGYDDDTEEGFR